MSRFGATFVLGQTKDEIALAPLRKKPLNEARHGRCYRPNVTMTILSSEGDRFIASRVEVLRVGVGWASRHPVLAWQGWRWLVSGITLETHKLDEDTCPFCPCVGDGGWRVQGNG